MDRASAVVKAVPASPMLQRVLERSNSIEFKDVSRAIDSAVGGTCGFLCSAAAEPGNRCRHNFKAGPDALV